MDSTPLILPKPIFRYNLSSPTPSQGAIMSSSRKIPPVTTKLIRTIGGTQLKSK